MSSPLAAGALALGLCAAPEAELGAGPQESLNHFVESVEQSLQGDESEPLESLFLPEGRLRAQSRALFSLCRGLALSDHRAYWAPDIQARHAFVVLKFAPQDRGYVTLVRMRLVWQQDRWWVSRQPSYDTVPWNGQTRSAEIRSEVRVLQSMMEGVPEFVEEMSLLYTSTP